LKITAPIGNQREITLVPRLKKYRKGACVLLPARVFLLSRRNWFVMNYYN